MNLFDFFSGKKNKNITADEFFDKYKSVLSEAQFDQIENVNLGFKAKVTFSDEEIEYLDKKLEERNKFDELLSNTADRNNKGLTLEKTGDIDGAINVYEMNIGAGYPATHSYERLMILYRKKKMYADELRVIQRAIEIFTKENERRFKIAYNNPENKSIKENLQIGLQTCTEVIGTNGWCAYNPYPVIKWIERMEKVKKLIK